MKALKNIIALSLLICNLGYSQTPTNFNKLDEKGNKNGLWKGNYEDTKNPKYEGTFEHGKEVGIFTFYDNTQIKAVIATRQFNPKDNSAYTIFYDQQKSKVSEGKVVNKKFEGLWKFYHRASDKIMTTENYVNGKLEGERKVYFPTGKIAEEMNYKNNLKEGVYKKYTENGTVIEESNFKNGNYNGVVIFRNSNGDIASRGQFNDGKKSGIWQFFDKDKLIKEEDYNKILPLKFAKSKHVKEEK